MYKINFLNLWMCLRLYFFLFVFLVFSLFFGIFNISRAEYVPSLNPDYGSIQQVGEYIHIRTGFVCTSSSITIGFTNLLSNVASDVSAGGAIQDVDGEYIDFDPPISSGVWYFTLYDLYSGFDTVYPVSYFTDLWPNQTAYKLVLDCATQEGTVRSWFLINSEDKMTYNYDIGTVLFLGMFLFLGIVWFTFWVFSKKNK